MGRAHPRGRGPSHAAPLFFVGTLVLWGLKTGLEKFKDGVKDAAKAQGGAVANAGIGWVLGTVFGIDLSRPDQQEITNQRLEAIADTLAQHTAALQRLETQVGETLALLREFVLEYRANTAVARFEARQNALAPQVQVLRTYADRLERVAAGAAREIAATGELREHARLSPALEADVRLLAQNTRTYVEPAYDAVLAAVQGRDAPSILDLFADAARLTLPGGAAYPRWLAPQPLMRIWLNALSLTGPFLEGADLQLEASHVGPGRPPQPLPTPPELRAKLDRTLQAFDAAQREHLPRYAPLPDAAVEFVVDPQKEWAMTAAPIGGAARRWTRRALQTHLETATLGGERYWQLPSSQMLQDLIGEARSLGIGAAEGELNNAAAVLLALGFQLVWEDDAKRSHLAVEFMTVDGSLAVGQSTLGERLPPSDAPLPALVWKHVAPNAVPPV